MMNCGKNCQPTQESTTPKDPIQAMVEDIQSLFEKEGSAINYVSDHEAYLHMLKNAPFFVSGIHTQYKGQTWWAAAVDKESYDRWEEDVEHQHHPCEEHEHYMCVKPREEFIL